MQLTICSNEMLRSGANSAPTHLLAGFSVERERLRKEKGKGNKRRKKGEAVGDKEKSEGGKGGILCSCDFS